MTVYGADRLMRLLITVTLNHNQLRSHLAPILALDEVSRATLVADAPGPQITKLRTVVPPRWLMRIAGRAAAKLLTSLVLALRERPSWVLGYHLVPHGITAGLVARLSGARSYVHLIGGPVEWRGGAVGTDNQFLSRLGRPVPALEGFLLGALRRADVVAVMGTRARAELIEAGLQPGRVVVLPASVDPARVRVADGRFRYDVVTASQLIPRKRIRDLLLAAQIVRRTHPELRVAIAGRGPLDRELAAEAEQLGLAGAVVFLGFVEQVGDVYASARMFVLPSQREGLSIAMTEAMSAGVPVIVTDIGEARDVVVEGESGFVFEVGDVQTLAARITALMDDDALRARMSTAAVEAVRDSSSPQRIAEINRRMLTGRPSHER